MTTEIPVHTFREIEFRLEIQSLTGKQMVEVLSDGVFIGAIYQTPHGLRFISKYAVAPVVMPDETCINKLSIIELLYKEIHA